MKDYSNSKVPGLFSAMEKKGIKAADITKEFGIKSGNISDWKSGKSAPSAAVRKSLAEFLGVTVEYLASGDSELQPPSEGQKENAPAENSEGEILRDYLNSLVDRMDDEGVRDLLRTAEGIVLQRPKEIK